MQLQCDENFRLSFFFIYDLLMSLNDLSATQRDKAREDIKKL